MLQLLFGNAVYKLLDKSELVRDGFQLNRNIAGEKFFFCVGCNRYTNHFHMSKGGKTVAVCQQCERTAL